MSVSRLVFSQGRGGGGGGFTSGAVVEEEEDLRGQPADPALQPEKFGNLEDAVEVRREKRQKKREEKRPTPTPCNSQMREEKEEAAISS